MLEGGGGHIPAKIQLIPLSVEGGQSLGRSSVKYAGAIQRLCIIERSKWEQEECRGSVGIDRKSVV